MVSYFCLSARWKNAVKSPFITSVLGMTVLVVSSFDVDELDELDELDDEMSFSIAFFICIFVYMPNLAVQDEHESRSLHGGG